jgi:uncharacterized protein (DUF2336 family)
MTSAPEKKTVPLSVEEALRLLEERARQAQNELATKVDAGEDVLHFLAINGAAATRRAVAANPAATPESNRVLADDRDDEVRVELAQKIGQVMPGLLTAERDHLMVLTIATLERLARDQTARVRAVLAEEIKHLDCVPKDVVQLLANDTDPVVAAPIIECSPLLSDRELLEIVTNAQMREVLGAVARRKGLSGDVSDAVVGTLDVPAIGALLMNTQAQLRKKTLDKIVVMAGEVKEWHDALVVRPELSPKLVGRVAQFVSATLIDVLAQRSDLDENQRTELKKLVHEKLEKERAVGARGDDPANEVEAVLGSGNLDDAFIEQSALAGQKETVVLALSHLARTRPDTVRQILTSGSAKPLTALVWRAGLNMRTSFKLQILMMRLKSADLLAAKNGTDFPLTEDEMRWHLNYFNIQ